MLHSFSSWQDHVFWFQPGEDTKVEYHSVVGVEDCQQEKDVQVSCAKGQITDLTPIQLKQPFDSLTNPKD